MVGGKIMEKLFNLKKEEKVEIFQLYNDYENGNVNEDDVINYFKQIRTKSYKYAVEKMARKYGVNPRKCSSTDEIFEKIFQADVDDYNDFILDLKTIFFEKCGLDYTYTPRMVVIPLDTLDEDDIETSIADYLSDNYGYCVNTFRYEIIENNAYITSIDWDRSD
jgi:hypothetical protein